MKINANALAKLVYFFSNMKWSKNNKTNAPMSEEIIEQLFRDLEINELSTICLFTFYEYTTAVKDYQEGSTCINLKLYATEFNDCMTFSYEYVANPKEMSESEEKFIIVNSLRKYKDFCYDFATKKWSLSKA